MIFSSIFTLSCGRHGQVNVISNSPNNIYMVDNGFVGIMIQMRLFVKTTLYAFMLHLTVRTVNGKNLFRFVLHGGGRAYLATGGDIISI